MSSDLCCPPGFEVGFKSNTPSKQSSNLGVGSDTEQNLGRSECSTTISNENVPQTPIYDSIQVGQREYDEDAILSEEELVEA